MKVSRVDVVLAAIRQTLEKHSSELDAVGLDSISLIVKFDRHSGHPFRVVLRTEAQEDVSVSANLRRATA